MTRARGALGGLLDEIQETARLATRGCRLETGATPLTAEQQPVHDLGMTAGMQDTLEVLHRHGLLHVTEEKASPSARRIHPRTGRPGVR